MIMNPTYGIFGFIKDAVNTVAGGFASWGDALKDANIPVLSDVAGAADIYKGWVESGFDKATGQLGDTFENPLDFARRLIAFDDALDGIGDVVKVALNPQMAALQLAVDNMPHDIYYGTNGRRRLIARASNSTFNYTAVVGCIQKNVDPEICIEKYIDAEISDKRRKLVVGDIVNALSSVPGVGTAVEGVRTVADTIAGQVAGIPGISHVVGGVSTAVGTVQDTANKIKGSTDQIPGIGGNINNILNTGIPGLNGKLGNIQNVGIPGLDGKLGNIQNVGIPGLDRKLDDILGDQLKGLPLLDGKLDDIIKIIEIMIQNPLSITDILGDEVNELADTLQTCVGKISNLIDPLGAMYEILLKNLPNLDLDFIPDIPDMSEVAFKVMAVAMLPFKPAIELACDEILPDAIDFIKSVLTGIGLRRRRMSDNVHPDRTDVCKVPDDQLCDSKPFTWSHEPEGAYRKMARDLPDRVVDGDNIDAGSSGDVYQEHRIVVFVFNMILPILDELCGIWDDCIPTKVRHAKCAMKGKTDLAARIAASSTGVWMGSGVCRGVSGIIKFIVTVIEYVIGSADLVDGLVQFEMVTAIFNDRLAIIHNQKYLDHLINDKYDKLVSLIQTGNLGVTSAIENERYSLRFISNKLQDLEQAFYVYSDNAVNSAILLLDTYDSASATSCKGQYFDIYALADITITGISWKSSSADRGFELYERDGSYDGFETDSSKWINICQGVAIANVEDRNTPSRCDNVEIKAGATRGFYLYLNGDGQCKQNTGGNKGDVIYEVPNVFQVEVGPTASGNGVFGAGAIVNHFLYGSITYTAGRTLAREANLNMDIVEAPRNAKPEEIGIMTITLRMTDLYIFVMVQFGLCVCCIAIGLLIGKYCMGNSGNQFAAIPKYDYSTSDIEKANE